MWYLEYKRNKAKEDAECRFGESREGYGGELECVKGDIQVWKQEQTNQKQKHPVFVQSCTYGRCEN